MFVPAATRYLLSIEEHYEGKDGGMLTVACSTPTTMPPMHDYGGYECLRLHRNRVVSTCVDVWRLSIAF